MFEQDDGQQEWQSYWHAGERALQERHGVAEKMERLGARMIRDHMPEQHRVFYAQLPFILAGVVDAAGDPWATLIEGRPGFMASPDPRSLWIGGRPSEGDPARGALGQGAPVGLLGIELHTRRRNRLNGRVTRAVHEGLEVAVEQTFGNCPQHIRPRDAWFAGPPGTSPEVAAEHATGLDDEARRSISAADTFFVASFTDRDGRPAHRTIDVSHRGGKPGFVRAEGDTLTIADYSGNMFFSTLGNLLSSRRAGLLFVDFERGDVLQITGAAEVILEGAEIGSFEGAERLWRVKTERMVRRRGALSLRWKTAPPG